MKKVMTILACCAFVAFAAKPIRAQASGVEQISNRRIVDAYEMTASEETGAAVINGIFDKKYVVIVSTTIMRSGPGTSYENVGILYKGDIISVSKISDGWAKFKINGEYRYVREADIERR